MEIFLGDKGINNSWQEPFKAEIKCPKCKGKARIMFSGFEDREKEYICNLHKTTGKEGGLWLHDAMACAIYLCPHCFEVSGILNQA